MKTTLFPFQIQALRELRSRAAYALGYYNMQTNHEYNQIVSLQAPTGAGKTIIMAALIEDILYGSDTTVPQPEAIFVWLSDSPSLNLQSRDKISFKSDKIREGQCVVIEEESFDQEYLSEGHIYFLNTQKLSKSGKLGKHGDGRSYTIWETLDNTARDKSNRLYFIIDEAHRGMQGTDAGKATSIMQRFIKGFKSTEHTMRSMPLIIGMSATAERFNRLVDNCPHCNHALVTVPVEDVRQSGLLKDRIIIMYPEDISKYDDTAVLQAAVKEWMNKRQHWLQLTRDKHEKNINPILVVQVEAGSGNKDSNTDLDAAVATIEEGMGERLQEYEAVHTFGSGQNTVMNGLTVHYIEPERINEDRRIKVVFFKENLSTGWDCPRAETLMSYRRAEEATYIAQLLGRMIRTPLGARVNVDESLNEVRLFLPYYNRDNVAKVVDELKSSEGGAIPAYIDDEQIGRGVQPYTVHTGRRGRREVFNPNQQTLDIWSPTVAGDAETQLASENAADMDDITPSSTQSAGNDVYTQVKPDDNPVHDGPSQDSDDGAAISPIPSSQPEEVEEIPLMPELDREEILSFINSKGYLTFKVKDVKVNDYLKSLLDLSSLLVRYAIDRDAWDTVKADVLDMIHNYAQSLRTTGQYKHLKQQVLQMKLSVQMFDVFGEVMQNGPQQQLFLTSAVLERQGEMASVKLGRAGLVDAYLGRYQEELSIEDGQVDCILFVVDDDCMKNLHEYAGNKFHALEDEYRVRIANMNDSCRKEYSDIIAQGDEISRHNLFLPETTPFNIDGEGDSYYKHLYADEETGVAKLKLNTWERGTLQEEEQRDDFACWLRNPSRASWALCIPYELNNVTKPMYPDFLIVRRDQQLKYVIDVLEPHGSQYADSLAKAKGMAAYAGLEGRLGRVQMIREKKEHATGKIRYLRLDFTKRKVREAVKAAMTVDEFDHIFENMGEYQ